MAKLTSSISCLNSLPPPRIHEQKQQHASPTALCLPSLSFLPLWHLPSLHLRTRTDPSRPDSTRTAARNSLPLVRLLSGSLALSTLVSPALAAEWASLASLQEPANALSLHLGRARVQRCRMFVDCALSVLRITAMALVWQYGEVSGCESWKGLSWGMIKQVPLLGGAFCACTWHFFYNSESLEVLVALQAALTVIGNATMCFAAFRIYRASEGRSKKL